MRYLLDTNHAGSLLRPGCELASRLSASATAEYCLCIPSIGELWYMVYNSTRVAENQRRLESLLHGFVVLPFDETAAREFGRLVTELRRAGRPIPSIDAQIAAIARAQNATLLTADGHFAAVPGLKWENWL